ncbi:type II secretion system F family protein [Leekyejoonella antrihumi]|uniref:Type II secretion system F family protein n=1 Tax=Leekyejoonella antrihumi TaxID=1660198 RepID=A0A563DWG7_9MICO|nr:type II secretion system F family protein [Leekyejoonella antrihumi]TWP34311.1 type II secretion system F family protein [Leekyejoonella antrihumi]
MSAGWPLTVAALSALAVLTWPRRSMPVPEQVESAASGDGPVRAEDVTNIAAALDLLALALGSGVPLVHAVDAVAARSGPVVRRDLRQVVAALRWGVDESAAWDGLPVVWRPAGRALTLAGIAGVPPAALIRRAASDIRRREAARLEEAAGRLGVLIVIPLGACFLPAFALLTVVPAVVALASSLMGGVV